MEIGTFEQAIEGGEILRRAEEILPGTVFGNVRRICEQYGEEAGDCRKYDVYRLSSAGGDRILKKTSRREADNYERYLRRQDFAAPAFYGSRADGSDVWILTEYIAGHDLREMTKEAARAAAESLAQIQNGFWGHPDTERFDVYRERIRRRGKYIQDEPVIGRAYRLFLERQEVCPRTLSHGDFLQWNAIGRGGRVYLIDWGFGGIMPYSLDIARFIAHTTENRATFPFFMTRPQKRLFLDGVYERLKEKPDYPQYIRDIRLAVLNEYVEFIEADEDEDGWYARHAGTLAKEILRAEAP